MQSASLKYSPSTPMMMLTTVSRTVFLLFSQALVALYFYFIHNAHPWLTAAPWWTVWGTLADIACLSLLYRLTHKQNQTLRSLLGKINFRFGHDVFLGLGYFLLAAPVFFAATFFAARLVFHTATPPLFENLLSERHLPLWGVLFSLLIWWPLWSLTEELLYNGYLQSRLALTFHSRAYALAFLSFWWALQHSFLPLLLDWHYCLWRFFAFLPGVILLQLLYLRTQRLAPIVLAHWLLDLSAVYFTLKL